MLNLVKDIIFVNLKSMSLVSLVIPVYNEEEVLPELIERLVHSLKFAENYEIIFVNDGSSDNTFSILFKAKKENKNIKIINLSRNFGHQAAFTCGINFAKGDFIVMMDADLQDPPELIPEMFKKMKETDSDIIYAQRLERNETFFKRKIIWMFHKIFEKLSQNNQGDTGNFSIMNRKAINAFLSLNEKNRYLPGLRYFIGFKQDFVQYKRNDRQKGKAKMSFWKLVALAFDAIFSFSKLPLRIALILGILCFMISLIGISIVIYKKIIGEAITGWTSTMLSILFLGSVQLIFLGILGEYIYRIYKETQNRPIYIVKDYYE